MLLALFIAACQQSDKDRFLDILENRYANLTVNKRHKLKVLDKIKKYLSTHEWNLANAPRLTSLIEEMGDYHLLFRPVDKYIDYNAACISGSKLDANTFVLKIHSLWCESKTSSPFERFKQEFFQHATVARKFSKIVIDLRDNGGGGDQETRYLLQRLINKKSFLYAYQYLNKNLPFWQQRPFHRWAIKKTDYIMPLKNVADYLGDQMLEVWINHNTFSSAEVVASVLKFARKVKLIGERTKGGAGDPHTENFFDKKYEFIFPTCLVWQEDGSLYEGHGVLPSDK